jgi:hypothetical protein
LRSRAFPVRAAGHERAGVDHDHRGEVGKADG